MSGTSVEASGALEPALKYMRRLLSEGYHDSTEDAATDAARVHSTDQKTLLRAYWRAV